VNVFYFDETSLDQILRVPVLALRTPQGPTIEGMGKGTLEVPELPNARVYIKRTVT
jgi:hypothetical protein